MEKCTKECCGCAIGESNGFVGSSVNAYKRVYPPIAAALESGEKVTITYIDFDNA